MMKKNNLTKNNPVNSAQRLAISSLVVANGIAGNVFAESIATERNAEGETPDLVELPAMTVAGEHMAQLSSPKYTTELKDTPQTISILPRSLFEEQGATTLRDVLRNTPGITFQAGEGGTPAGDQMTIRGFSARTDIFIDGVRDTGGYARDSFNLEQVEVSKGPSSATTGRGSTGGAINLVSKIPQANAFVEGDISIGTDDYKRATVDINQPLHHGGGYDAGLRLNTMWQDSDTPGRKVVGNSSWGIAPTLSISPGQDTTATLGYLHLQQNGIPDYGLPWNAFPSAYPRDTPVDQSNFYGLVQRDYEKITNDMVTLQFDHHFTDSLKLNNTTRYGRTVRDSITTAPRFIPVADEQPGQEYTTIRRTDWKSRDQTDSILANNSNLTARFNTGRVSHDLVAGAEVSREQSLNYTRSKTNSDSPNTNVYDPNPQDPYNEAIQRDGGYVKAEAHAVASYLFDTLHLGEKWDITAGVRWDRFEVDYKSLSSAGVVTSFKQTDIVTSWKGAVVYKPHPNGSIYAAVGTSFNPSAEGLTLNTNTTGVPPEESITKEIGSKWDFPSTHLSLSASLFDTVKTNARTPSTVSGQPNVLDGELRVRGVELGISGDITDSWKLFAGYAFMDSDVLRSNTAGQAGNDVPLTPRNTFNIWTTYEFPLGITLGGGAQYMGELYRSTVNTPQVPSYWLMNAMASYKVNDNLTFRVNISNLADKEYPDRVGGGHYIPGVSRQAILTAEIKF